MASFSGIADSLSLTALRQRAGALVEKTGTKVAEKINQPFSKGVEAKLAELTPSGTGNLRGVEGGVAAAVKLYKEAPVKEGVFGAKAHTSRLDALETEAARLEGASRDAQARLDRSGFQVDPIVYSKNRFDVAENAERAKGFRQVISELKAFDV